MTRTRPAPFGTPPTRLHAGRLMLVLCLLGAAGFGVWAWIFHKGVSTTAPVTESSTMGGWTATQHYTAEPKVEPLLPAPVDKYGEQIARILGMLTQMQGEITQMKGEIDALKKRPATTTVVKEPTKPPPPPPKVAGPPLFIHHDVKDAPLKPAKNEYTLAPGVHLPCIVESVINSDVPNYFTAKVSTNVWDSALGRHLLVPQNSTIVAKYHSEDLLYGNERVPTSGLTLSLPDGTSVDLGQAPVTDQLGVAGLSGDVNSHYGRLAAAVLIGGTLRAGTQALQTGLAQAAGAGPVAAGYGSVLNQAVSPRIGRALDTRPTITVFSGQLCQVLLIKPLVLKAQWE